MLHPAVRIIPPSEVSGDQWTAEHILERRRYRLSRAAAAALVAACRPQEVQDLVGGLRARDGDSRSVRYWTDLVNLLGDRRLVTDASAIEDDPQLSWLVNLRKRWSRYGWHEAFEYHALTFDYPCLDYSEATALAADRSLMRGYQATEPDIDRCKLDYLDQPGIPLPEPVADMSTGTAPAVWGPSPPPVASVERDSFFTILSLTFGVTGAHVPVTDAAPLLRRTSPSGGGRHPSEGYVFVRRIDGLELGWYHVTIRPLSLRRLDGRPVGEDRLRRAFPETMLRFPGDIRALVVITSVFERNMYRYREPRTFRTVHMDAGHLAGTLRIAARSLGLRAGISYCDNATNVEEMLGIDGMREGYMLTVAFADGVERRA